MLTMRKVLLPLLLLSVAASARTLYEGQWAQVDPDTRKWYNDQMVPGTDPPVRCCSNADGDQVEEDIRDGKYWIRGAKLPRWTLVPDNTVLVGPNKAGHPVVWLAGDVDSGTILIKCYAPGAKG